MLDFEPIELAETIEENGTSDSLISALEDIQGRYRYLPQEALVLVSERLVKDDGLSCHGCHTQRREQGFVFSEWRD